MSWIGWADGDDMDCFATFGPCETLDDLKAEAQADFAKDCWSDGRWSRGVLYAGEVEEYPMTVDAEIALEYAEERYSCEVPFAEHVFDGVSPAEVDDLQGRLTEALAAWMGDHGIECPTWVPKIEKYAIEEMGEVG